jgi:hypothetical protein
MSPSANEKKTILQLAHQRIITLQQATKGLSPPTFSWCQPKAVWEGSGTGVQEFLHSNVKEKTFHHFSDSGHASNWAYKYFGYARNGTYDAEASVEERCVVRVVKDRTHHDQLVQLFDELKRLTVIFGIELNYS